VFLFGKIVFDYDFMDILIVNYPAGGKSLEGNK